MAWRFGQCEIERDNKVFRCEFRAMFNPEKQAIKVEVERILQNGKVFSFNNAEKPLDLDGIIEEITFAIGRPWAESRLSIGWSN